MINHALRIRRRRRDVLQNITLACRRGDVQWGEIGLGQRGEDVMDEGRDVGCVLGIGVVDGGGGAGDEVCV